MVTRVELTKVEFSIHEKRYNDNIYNTFILDYELCHQSLIEVRK